MLVCVSIDPCSSLPPLPLSLRPFLPCASSSPATLVCSKPLEAVLTKPVYLTILLIGGLVFIAWGVLAFRSAAGDAFSLHADGRGGLSVVMSGGVWFEAGALRLRALELRDSEGAVGAPRIASLGLLRDGCRVAAAAETGRGSCRGLCCVEPFVVACEILLCGVLLALKPEAKWGLPGKQQQPLLASCAVSCFAAALLCFALLLCCCCLVLSLQNWCRNCAAC